MPLYLLPLRDGKYVQFCKPGLRIWGGGLRQGLLSHTPPETGVPPTIFNNKHSKIGLKVSALAVINLGPGGVTSRNLST